MTVSEIERKLALLQHDCQSLASLDGIEKGERRAIQAIVSQIANIRHELTAALSDQAVVPKASQGIVRTVGWIRNDDADPNDEDAVRFFGVVVEYPNEPPTFSPSIVWAKTPVCIVIAPPPSSTAGEG